MSSTASVLPRRVFLGGLATALLGAVLFSAKAVVAKLMYRYQVDAVMVITLRMLFCFPVFIGIAIWKGHRAPSLSRQEWIKVFFLGFTGYYLSSFLDFLGLQYISVGLERLILFLTPSFVLLISFFFYQRKIARLEWGALGVSYLGTIFVLLHDIRLSGSYVWLGSALVLGAAVSYALYLIHSGELVRRMGVLRLVSYVMCISAGICIIQFFILRSPSELLQPVGVYQLSVVNALFCTVLPVFMTMYAVSRIGASTASMAGLIGPVSMLFMGAAILDEPITAIQVVGTALVLAGMYLLSRKKS
jgi:drug/metabolite transporter (DMT)-like permease